MFSRIVTQACQSCWYLIPRLHIKPSFSMVWHDDTNRGPGGYQVPGRTDRRHIMRVSGLFLTLLVLALGTGTLVGPARASEQEEQAAESVGRPSLDMKPFNFSIIKRGIVEGQATLQLVLMTQNTTDFEFVRSRLPQVRSDFNTALSVLAQQHFDVNRPIDPDVVKAYLTPYLDHRLGKGKAEVFVRQALIHPN